MIDPDIVTGSKSQDDGGAKDYQNLIISKLYEKHDELMALQAKWGGTGRNEKQYADQAQGVSEAILVIRNTDATVDERLKEDDSV